MISPGAPSKERVSPGRRPESEARKILFVIGSLHVGGTEQHLVSVSRELVRRGWSVSVYSLQGVGHLRAAIEAAGVNLFLPPIRNGQERRSAIWRLGRLTVATVHLFLTMIRLRPDIVHFMLPEAYLLGAPLAFIARRPVRVMSRRSMNVYQLKHPILAVFERFLHRSVSAIVGNSRTIVRELKELEGVAVERLGLIYNGLDLSSFANVNGRQVMRKSLDVGPHTLLMIVVANLIPYKGHLDLIDAFSKVETQGKPDWRLLLVGRDDGMADEIRCRSKAAGIDDKIVLLGQRDDVAGLLLAADIGILCSHQEGFANAILEGMGAGLPMIVTDVGGNSEVVQDGITGLVVSARNPARLAEAIITLSNDAEMRRRLGEAGRRRVAQHFSLETCIDRYEALYRALLAGGAPGDVPSIRVS